MNALRSPRLAARLWWLLLPYAGWTSYPPNPENPAPWYAYPLTWLWKFVGRLPSSAPFKPMEQIMCSCDECMPSPAASVTEGQE